MTRTGPTGVARRTRLGLPPRSARASSIWTASSRGRNASTPPRGRRCSTTTCARGQGRAVPFTPFDEHDDYLRFVDGKTRADGVRSFLGSRGIELPDGRPDDPVARETVHGLGNRKNEIVLAVIARIGVEVYDGLRPLRARRPRGGASLRGRLLERQLPRRAREGGSRPPLRRRGRRRRRVAKRLAGSRLRTLPGRRADGLGVEPAVAAVFEDAEAGVEAGRMGGFGFVVGVDRSNRPHALRDHGADVVVGDLEELLTER